MLKYRQFDWSTEKTKYLCIHCKEGFSHLPPAVPNECISGHTHTFIKRSNIISDKKREELAQAYLWGKKIGEKILGDEKNETN